MRSFSFSSASVIKSRFRFVTRSFSSSHASGSQADSLTAQALLLAGEQALRAESIDEARGCFEKALKASTGDKAAQLQAENRLGFTYALAEDMQKAGDCFENTLLLARETADSASEATALINIASIALRRDNDTEKAITSIQEALAIREALGSDLDETIDAVLDYASTLMMIGQMPQALAHTNDALGRLNDRKDKGGNWAVLQEMALGFKIEISSHLRVPEADEACEELLQLSTTQETVKRVATYYARINNGTKAAEVMQRLEQTVESLSQLGMLQSSNNQFEEAQETLRKAVSKAEKNELIKPLWLLSQVVIRNEARGKERFVEAQKLMTRILVQLKNAKQPLFAANVTFALARVVAEQELFNQATYHMKAALHLLDDVRDKEHADEVGALRKEIKEELEAVSKKKPQK